MEIYYLKKDEFLKSVNFEKLEKFSDGREYLSEEKYFEHLCGIFLTKFVAKHFYNVENLEIEFRNRKPFFKSNEICFSISHSNNIVLVAFNNKNIGVDVEYMCPRNFSKIMNRYGKNDKSPTKIDFYRFWTLHEAEIKLGGNIRSLFSSMLGEDYMLTCVSDDVLVTNFCIKELKHDKLDIY
uniref:4'-phosphopantetheinyl transferase domain-containing protein n=1 Tax=uncultured Candidatus Melainabacteria bacterium TaxID=2682970 RepID=A0A650EJC6_9BACT|nr:hypothetical protein Melaina855_1860 [uncultured Candidatus Melainabacteria bacterium]